MVQGMEMTKAAGFDQADKIYGVFYDGTSSTDVTSMVPSATG